MSIIVKNSQLGPEPMESLDKLTDLDINAAIAFKLTRIIKEISSIVEDKVKMERRILDKYSEKDEQGNIINEQLTSDAVRIFPNPVFNNTTLTVQGLQASAEMSIHLIDGSGREVQQHIISSTNKEKSFEFNVEDLAEGIYSVIVKSEKNTSALRFIKL